MPPEARPATKLKLVETGAATRPPSINANPAPSPEIEESVGIEVFRTVDRMREALAAQLTGGISPAALALAFFDWSIHLTAAPGKQMELAWKAARKAGRFATYVLASTIDHDAPPCIEPLPGDHRFAAEAWKRPPFNLLSQAFLLQQQWWHNMTHEVPGIVPHHEHVVSFVARQLLDMYSPSNNPFTNPEVIDRTLNSGGMNFVQGVQNWLEDVSRVAIGRPPVGTESFVVGRDVAVTPGKVVFRNHLIELIQYAPVTETVMAEPILIVPAWIMKYYILDLSPDHSLIRYLVQQGYTVFCISWRNPTAEDRDLALDDYRRLGVMAALDVISAIVPGRKIHATGYCLGGTLLSIASAAMARAHDDRLASVTLFATETDFTEPGELALFISHSGLHYRESMMWNKGYLSADQMAGAFALLRSNDLVWSRYIHEYMMGERPPMTDLMAWNADTTRMPYRMHSEYLQRLYVDNELAAGHFMVDGRPAAIQNIRVPMFVVATERDHVAPWRSVYKIHYLSETDVTFVLTSGGHNAGIVSEPGHPKRHYCIALKRRSDLVLSPDEWAAAASPREGSWWVDWVAWLGEHSASGRVHPPSMGAPDRGFVPIADAPGTYVHQR
jgi:poly[(R)-3-hydroxyalkanoate] polymerase subunit PhaC